MRYTGFAALVLATAVLPASLIAQTAKQDMNSAGHDTAAATKNTGHAVAKGTETGYDKTKDGTVKAAHATAHGTKVVAHKTKEGTVKAADATAHGTKVAARKTKNGTKSLVNKVDGK